MGRYRKLLVILFLGTFAGAMLPESLALIEGEIGNRPVPNSGWPSGSEDVANLPTRVGYWAGPPFGTGSQCQFLYRSRNTEEFNRALTAFAAIKSPRLDLVVNTGPEYSFWLKKDGTDNSPENRIDWTFTVWNASGWNQLYNDPASFYNVDSREFRQPVPPPRIDVYIGGGNVVWDKVTIPGKLTVIDRRKETAPIQPGQSGLLRVHVFDLLTRKPIPEAEVSVGQRKSATGWTELFRGQTDTNGIFEAKKVPPNVYYEIRVRAGEYGVTYAARKQLGHAIRATACHAEEIGMVPESSLVGIVTDPAGKPVSGVGLMAINILGPNKLGYPCFEDQTVKSDAHGRFEIKHLPVGFTQLRCMTKGRILRSAVKDLHPVPSKDLKLIVTGTGTVKGRLVGNSLPPDAQTPVSLIPMEGMKIGSWSGSTTIRKDGTFKFIEVPPGDYVITMNPRTVMVTPDKAKGKIVHVEADKEVNVDVSP